MSKYGESESGEKVWGRQRGEEKENGCMLVFHWDRWGQWMSSQGHYLQSSLFVEYFLCIDKICVNYVSKTISTQQLGICGQVNTIQYTRVLVFCPTKYIEVQKPWVICVHKSIGWKGQPEASSLCSFTPD